jgi:hypothetical protein
VSISGLLVLETSRGVLESNAIARFINADSE